MRLSRSVINNLCVLSLIGSVVEQMDTRRDQYPPELCDLHDELRTAHRYARETVLELAGIDTSEEGLMLLPESDFRRWSRTEKAFFDAVLKAVPEKTLDARMWMTAVLLVTEDYVDSIPYHATTHYKLWEPIWSLLASIYALYDPGYRCKKMMREGMDKGIKILEVLK